MHRFQRVDKYQFIRISLKKAQEKCVEICQIGLFRFFNIFNVIKLNLKNMIK